MRKRAPMRVYSRHYGRYRHRVWFTRCRVCPGHIDSALTFRTAINRAEQHMLSTHPLGGAS